MGDLQRMHNRVAARTRPGSGGLPERFKRRLEAKARRQAAEEEAALKAALAQQQINAQRERDRLLQDFQVANTNQRANISAGQAQRDFGYRSQLAEDDREGTMKRDELRNRFEEAQRRQQAKEQAERDRRLFEQTQQRDTSQFQNQLQRDATQMGYQQERDQFQQDATLKRDAMQFGFNTLRDDQQQQNLLERDTLQDVQQRQRDERLNQFDVQADDRRQQNVLQRDEIQQGFSVDRAQMQQEFTRESMYQREAAEISARWQGQVQQARSAGMEFSDRQRKQMQEMDATFRKNVLNGPWDEVMKQRALVEHQKKLSAIIPEQRVTSPDEEISQQFRMDPEWGPMKRRFDSQGRPDWEPLGMGGSGGGEDRQAMQREKDIQRATFEREDKFNDLVDRLASEVDPVSGEPKYPNRGAVMQEAKRRFDRTEANYREIYGLPPHPLWQHEADELRGAAASSAIGWDASPMQSADPQQQMGLSPDRLSGDSPLALRKLSEPVTISPTTIDDQMGQLQSQGEPEAAAALARIKELTAQFKGAPPDGTPEKAEMIDAIRFLKAKGVSLSGSQEQDRASSAREARRKAPRSTGGTSASAARERARKSRLPAWNQQMPGSL
jgi:hypothetical protein